MTSPDHDSRIGVRGSLFDSLRERVPDLRPVLASKATLAITSHLVEDLVARSPGRTVLVSGFQHGRHWAVERDRYLELAGANDIIAVFAGNEPPPVWNVDHVGVRLRDDDPLSQEWFVLALGPQLAVTLCGLDAHPLSGPRGPKEEGDRLFETVWSFDPEVARMACDVVLDAIGSSAPERAEEVRARVAEVTGAEVEPADVARGADNIVAGLLERMERLRMSEKRAERAASQAKTDFLSRMSHELRTPLNAVLGFAQVLELNAGEDTREPLEHILHAGRHLLELIDEVLDISRIEAGRLELALEPIDLAEPLRECIAVITPLADQRDVSMVVTVPDGLRVTGDRRRLSQIFFNLLSNAVKYNAEGGEIRVDGAVEDGWVSVRVRDTGAGIAAEDIGRLFVAFERLGDTGEVEGTGLGLALSQRMAEAMGGRIDADSRRGRGTVFTLRLPPLAEPEPAASAERPLTVPGRRTVLYVEDNASNIRLVEWILATRGDVELVGAAQGKRGLELARELAPAIILLDVHLPDRSGQDILAELRGDPATAGIPVIVVTADAMVRFDELEAAGATAALTKPVDVRELLATVARLLDQEP